MTHREKRNRQKRPRADVRKVHRYGFVPGFSNALRSKVDGPRNIYDAACGKVISDLRRRHVGIPYAVPDDSFAKLPRAFQCETCLTAPWPGNWPPRIQRSGVRTHRMALEMLFASMQRLWQARLEVGHRCYHQLHWHSVSACASCGERSLCDVDSLRAEIEKTTSRIVLSPQIKGGWFSAAVRMEWSEAQPCPCAPGGGDGPHAEWCDGGK